MLKQTLDQRITRAYKRLLAARKGEDPREAVFSEMLDDLLDQRLRMADELK